MPTEPPPRSRNWALVLLLLVVAGGIRTWHLAHTEVVAHDGIVFIDYALQLDRQPWDQVFRDKEQHPGYPLTILAVSVPVRHFFGSWGTDCEVMQWSAQLAAALAGTLLVLPMFYLGKELVDRTVAFWATLLFQCLPVSGRILSDALSEALFLLLAVTALYVAVRAIRARSSPLFCLCGLCSGLAYLTRPEGVILLAAMMLLLLLMQLVPSWRRPWSWTLASTTNLTLAALAVGNPYMAVINGFTNKASKHLYGTPASEGNPSEQTFRRTELIPFHSSPPLAVTSFSRLPFLDWLDTNGTSSERLGRGLGLLAREMSKGFHYFLWLPALLGIFWGCRQKLLGRPETWLILLLCLLQLALLWRLAFAAGYISERHVLLLVLCGLYPAVVGLRELAVRIAAWWKHKAQTVANAGRSARRWRWFSSAPAWSVVLLLAAAGSGLPKTLQRLHANHAGHRAAGLWLAKHARPADLVYDGHFGWASYYAGRMFLSRPVSSQPPKSGRVIYFVKGTDKERTNPFGPEKIKMYYTDEEIRTAGGKIVWRWPPHDPTAKDRVVIWKVQLHGQSP